MKRMGISEIQADLRAIFMRSEIVMGLSILIRSGD